MQRNADSLSICCDDQNNSMTTPRDKRQRLRRLTNSICEHS